MSKSDKKPGTLSVNRNNELTEHIPLLKKIHKTGRSTIAIYRTIDQYFELLTEVEQLRGVQHKYDRLKEALLQKKTAEKELLSHIHIF